MEKVLSDRFAKTVERFVKTLILGIWTVIMLGLLIICTVQTVDMVENLDMYFVHDSLLKNLFWIAAAYIVATGTFLIVKRFIPDNIKQWIIRNKNYIGIGLTAAVAIFLIWYISVTLYEPAGDTLICMQAAEDFLNGDKEYWISGYVSVFPFQNGLVFFDMLLILLFGDSAYIVFQYVNVLFFIIAVIAIYKTCGYIFRKENSLFIWFALLLYYPFVMYVLYCYGTMIGFSFAALAGMFLFMYFDKRMLRYIVLCAISILLSIIVKPNYSIVLVGIILYLLFDFVTMKKTKSFAGAIIVMTVYLAGSKSVNVMFDNIIGIHNEGMPKIAWVAMGMNDSVNTPGWIDGYSTYVYEKNNRDKEATVHESISHIGQRIKILLKQKRFLTFQYKKIASQWNEPTFESLNLQMVKSNAPENPFKEIVLPENNRIYKAMMNVCQTLINFGAVIYIFMKWKNFRDLSVYELFNAVLMIGAFIFWAVWEAKSQYVVPYYYLIIPYAVVGWKSIVIKTESILAKKMKTVKREFNAGK